MMTDAEVLTAIDGAFGSLPRPKRFTVADGDPECMEYDIIFHRHTPENLPIKYFCNSAYCPLSELLPEGFTYFFPAFTRFLLSEEPPELYWHGDALFGYLQPYKPFMGFCTSKQKRAVANLLEHLVNTREALAEDSFCFEELVEVSDAWKKAVEALPASSP